MFLVVASSSVRSLLWYRACSGAGSPVVSAVSIVQWGRTMGKPRWLASCMTFASVYWLMPPLHSNYLVVVSMLQLW